MATDRWERLNELFDGPWSWNRESLESWGQTPNSIRCLSPEFCGSEFSLPAECYCQGSEGAGSPGCYSPQCVLIASCSACTLGYPSAVAAAAIPPNSLASAETLFPWQSGAPFVPGKFAAVVSENA